jgi:hypothetical protein
MALLPLRGPAMQPFTKPALLPPSPKQVVIEVLESVEGDGEILAALRHIKSQGYTVALDDFVLTDATRPLLDLADIIKLDMLETPPTRKQVEHYLTRGITLVKAVEKPQLGEPGFGWDGQLAAINARLFLADGQKWKIHHSRQCAAHPQRSAVRCSQARRFFVRCPL